MSYRDDLDALAQRVKALEGNLEQDKRELEGARRVLDEARRKLPVLDDIRVATPCHASWDEMAGDQRARFCGSCQKNVYNLSSMTRVEAEALILAKEGKLCVRYFRRADGTILTNDCEVGVRKHRRKRRMIAAAFGAMSAAAAAASTMRPTHMMMMGEPARTTTIEQSPEAPTVMPQPYIVGQLAPPPAQPKRAKKKHERKTPAYEIEMGDPAFRK